MSTLQLKRGTTAVVSAYVPAAGEPVLDTSLKQLRIGDGVTSGGTVIGSPTSPFMRTVLDDTSEGAARTTLGAAASGVNTDILSIAGSAATLTTSRSIAATGDASWSVNFNGSANATGALTLAASGVTAGTYGSVTVDAKGRVTAASTLTPIANGGTGSGATAMANLTLQNSWTVVGGGRAAYRKIIDCVILELRIQGGTAADSTLLATLPAGFRPAFQIVQPVASPPNTALSTTVATPRININTDGTITCANCSSGQIQVCFMFSTT